MTPSADPELPKLDPQSAGPQLPDRQLPDRQLADPRREDLARLLLERARDDARLTSSSRPGTDAAAARSAGFGRGGPRRFPRRGPSSDPDSPPRSGPSPDRRDPQLLGGSLDALVRDRGWSRQVAVASLFSRWEEVVGPDVAAHARPERYDEITRELHIRTDSTAWRVQLRFLGAELLRRLNEVAGDNSVSLVQIHGPQAPSWKHGRLSVQGRGPRDTYG